MNEITNTNNVSKVMLNVNNNQQLKPHTTTADTTNSHVSIQIINNKPIAEFIPTVVESETKQTIENVIMETKMSENRYYSEKKSEPVLSEEIIEIINVPVEKKVEQKVVEDMEDCVNHSKVHVSVKEVELSRPTSPLWTYTLPAPPIFADNNASLDNQQPTQQLCTETNTFYNDFTSTVGVERMCSETTTVISDTTIQPIICERKMLDDSFITIVQENNKLMDDTESEKSAEVITSDIEDGYQGGKKPPMVIVQEKKFIFQKDKMANELMKADDDFDISPVVLRHQITRSDSFHSIGQQNFRTSALSFSPQKSEMKSKSISYISLVQAQKNEALMLSKSNSNNMLYSKRKSTSELSITDSPSLQSLEVMKSILNSSRKSSLQDAVIMEQPSLSYKEKSLDHNVVTVQSVTAVDIKVPEKYSPIEETIAEKDKVPEHSNKWKYQGPPKINLSTWSERPKIEVSIKSDNDYKFGGSSTLPRVLKTTTTSNNNTTAITINQTTDDGVNETKSPVVVNTDENSLDEVDNRLPKVLGFEYKKKNSFVQLREHTKMPTDNSSTDNSKISIKPRPVSMDISMQTKSWTSSPASQIISFNRLSTSHNKFVPVVYGFKLNNISEVSVNTTEPTTPKEPKLLPVVERKPVVESKIIVENKTIVEVLPNKVNEKETVPVVPVKPSYLRSTSVDDMSKKFRFTTYDNRSSLTTVESNPFSQQTLRRTGLKQKILLQDTETESIFGRVIEVQPTTIKLSNQHAYQSERKSSVDIVKSTNRQLSSPNPPPPPPMAPSFKTMKKPQPIEADTRNQLLESIKRFNRDLLKRE